MILPTTFRWTSGTGTLLQARDGIIEECCALPIDTDLNNMSRVRESSKYLETHVRLHDNVKVYRNIPFTNGTCASSLQSGLE